MKKGVIDNSHIRKEAKFDENGDVIIEDFSYRENDEMLIEEKDEADK